MEQFTYQTKCNNGKLETYEWDNIWWEHAENTQTNRVLIIGDSISCGYRGMVNILLDGKIYADGLGTSKGIDNPYYKKIIDYVLAQQTNCKMIFLNNGLHGFHLNTDEYENYFDEIVAYLKSNYSEIKLNIVLTTPVKDSDRIEVVRERNKAVERIADKYNIDVIDCFSAIDNHMDYIGVDNTHLTEKGYTLLSNIIVEKISEFFSLPKKTDR